MNQGLTRTIALRAAPKREITQWVKIGVAVLTGYLVADYVVLILRAPMLPTQAPPVKPLNLTELQPPARSEYAAITNRNIFSYTGDIPAPKVGGRKKGQDADPVPSQLPLALVGTIVHSNPSRSIAQIEIKGKNQALAFAPNKEVDRLATIVRIERNRVVLRNLNNGRLEFIENKDATKLNFTASRVIQRPDGPANIRIVGENKFEIPRSEVLRFTSDMSNIVMQASTVPHRKATGEIDGFQLTSIQPNSLFSQLGFLPMDVIKKANGEPVDSPAKAIELYNALRNSNTVKMTIERDGREIEFEYTVKN